MISKRDKLEVSLVLLEEIGADLEDQKEELAVQAEASQQCLGLAVSNQKRQEDIVRQIMSGQETPPEALAELAALLRKDALFQVKAAETRAAESRARLDLMIQILNYLKQRRSATTELYKSAQNQVKRQPGKRP